MKKIKIIFTGIFFIIFSTGIVAQGPPPPPGEHGTDTDKGPGGSAPISTGLIILLSLGAAYGGRKVYNLIKAGNIK